MKGPGTYILVIELEQECAIRVGALGTLAFGAGYYLYVGSALNGLGSRLARHLRRDKRRHWHIDYLLEHARVVEVWCARGPGRRECTWARVLQSIPCIVPSVRRFGASDCRCRTHLSFSVTRPEVDEFRALLQAGGALEVMCPGQGHSAPPLR